MDSAPAIAAFLVAGIAGWFGAGYQHLLFGDAKLRGEPATGRKLLALRAFLAVSSGVVAALAFRPDHYDFGPALLTALFGACLCVLASTDFDRRRIPDRLTAPAFVLALAFCWAWPDRSVADILLGTAAGLATGLVLVVVGGFLGNAMGIGDGKLMILIGALTGWPAILAALLYGIILGGVMAVAIMVKRGRRSTYAYGPYLAAGGAVVLLFADRFN